MGNWRCFGQCWLSSDDLRLWILRAAWSVSYSSASKSVSAGLLSPLCSSARGFFGEVALDPPCG
jgi:hypothetical protein